MTQIRHTRILLVEDDPSTIALMREVLSRHPGGCEVDTADSGAAALDKLVGGRYDLMLLDYKLPGMDGLKILSAALETVPGLPILFVTGFGSEKVAAEAIKLGACDYLVKGEDYHRNLPGAVAAALERARLKRELEEARQESLYQAQKLSNIGKIVSEVAHDLRNPITIFSTALETIRDSEDKAKAVEKNLDLMLRNVDRARNVINGLLDFSKPKEYRFAPHPAGRVVAELADSVKYKCQKQEVELRVEVPDGLPEVELDEQHFKGALLNLLLNAVEAMPEGGTLSVSAAAEGGRFLVRIADTGVGISAEDQKRLFQRYFTTKKTGTGLGLITANQVILRHHGSLRVQSETGKGAVFTIDLPLGGR